MRTAIISAWMGCSLILLATQVYSEQKIKVPLAKPRMGTFAAPGSKFPMMNVDPTLIRKSMQARSEYDDLTRQINAMQASIYKENSTIKKLQAKMRQLQVKIDAVLSADKELNKLKAKFQTIAPELPIGGIQKAPRPLFSPIPGKKK